MNMTNDLRRRIKNAIMTDMPTIGSKKTMDLSNAAEKRAREIAVEALPEDVRAIYNDADLRGYVNHEYVYTDLFGYLLPAMKNDDYNTKSPLVATINADPVFAAARDTYKGIVDASRDIEREINAHLATCKTLRAFTTRFPALAKYAPTDGSRTPTANLPATTALMDSLKAAGLSVEEGV